MTAPAMQAGRSCPKCGGMMFDNRTTKRNPKAPDFKCKNRACDGVIWPARGPQRTAPAPKPVGPEYGNLPGVPMEAEVQVAMDDRHARLALIFNLQERCFRHALELAKMSEQAEVPTTLEGLSALTAQTLIAFREGR